MRYVYRAVLAGGLGLAAAFLAACGASSGLLSASQAGGLTALLNRANQDVSSAQCYDADIAIKQLRTQIANLPGSINATLVSDLSRGAKTVEALANQDCGHTVSTAPHTGTSTVPATTTTTHTTSTATSPTTTATQTDTTSSTTTPSTSTTPTTPSTPATTTTTPGTTSTGASGGGAPSGGGGDNGQGNNQGNGQGSGSGD